MNFFLQLLAIVAQIVLLGTIIRIATAGKHSVLHRYLNPGCWFAFFYTLWFIIPQFVSITNDNFVLGFPIATQEDVLHSQWRLTTFVGTVLLGMLAIRISLGSWFAPEHQEVEHRDLRRNEQRLIWFFYVAGFIGTVYLATQLSGSEGFRSQLVKTPSGLAATTVSFFGIYAMAVLIGHTLYQRNYGLLITIVLALGTAIFFTAARGRLLWPIVLGTAYVACRRDKINWTAVFSVGFLGILVLLVFDPVFSSLRGGVRHFDGRELAERIDPSNIFMNKRNFDGFANFTLICSADSMKKKPNILVDGARDAFMGHYFPEVYEKGVGYGTTVPGMLWLAKGYKGLLLGGAAYGVMLSVLAAIFHRIRREPMFWSYCFAMTWLAAVGGNFHESLDKMVAIALPGFVWLMFYPLLRRLDPDPPRSDRFQNRAWRA